MSNYIFSPSPSFGISEEPFVIWEGGFSNSQIADIISIGESRIFNKALVGGNGGFSEPNPNIRISNTSWIDLQEDSNWLYDKLAYIARQLNGQFYKFDLYGFDEHFQYTVYNGLENGHYDWHLDSGVGGGSSPRKFTMVLQLTDPREYEGGELQILTKSDPTNVRKEKGLLVAFPSYTLHRVTPVTTGVRKTLVIWITGPSFR